MFDSEKELDPKIKDGPTMSHPFADGANLDTASLPLNPDLFCCCFGPCRYYAHIGVVEKEKASGMVGDQHRICRRFSDDEGEMDLSEANVDRCWDFKPPWWSLVGWKQLWIVASKLRASQQITMAEGSPVTLPLRLRIALLIGRTLQWKLPTLRFIAGQKG